MLPCFTFDLQALGRPKPALQPYLPSRLAGGRPHLQKKSSPTRAAERGCTILAQPLPPNIGCPTTAIHGTKAAHRKRAWSRAAFNSALLILQALAMNWAITVSITLTCLAIASLVAKSFSVVCTPMYFPLPWLWHLWSKFHDGPAIPTKEAFHTQKYAEGQASQPQDQVAPLSRGLDRHTLTPRALAHQG